MFELNFDYSLCSIYFDLNKIDIMTSYFQYFQYNLSVKFIKINHFYTYMFFNQEFKENSNRFNSFHFLVILVLIHSTI